MLFRSVFIQLYVLLHLLCIFARRSVTVEGGLEDGVCDIISLKVLTVGAQEPFTEITIRIYDFGHYFFEKRFSFALREGRWVDGVARKIASVGEEDDDVEKSLSDGDAVDAD